MNFNHKQKEPTQRFFLFYDSKVIVYSFFTIKYKFKFVCKIYKFLND